MTTKQEQAIGTFGNYYLYKGYYYDFETGLYYLNARYYDPSIGRFLSRDPDSGEKTDRISLNLYVYAYNNPINIDDPNGHGWWDRVKSWAKDKYNKAKKAVQKVNNKIKQAVRKVKQTIQKTVNNVKQKAKQTVKKVKQTISKAVKSAAKAVAAAGKAIASAAIAAKNFAVNTAVAAKNMAISAARTVGNAAASAWNTTKQFTVNTYNTVAPMVSALAISTPFLGVVAGSLCTPLGSFLSSSNLGGLFWGPTGDSWHSNTTSIAHNVLGGNQNAIGSVGWWSGRADTLWTIGGSLHFDTPGPGDSRDTWANTGKWAAGQDWMPGVAQNFFIGMGAHAIQDKYSHRDVN